MKLSRKHLRKIIIEAGVIPSDLIEYFINEKECNHPDWSLACVKNNNDYATPGEAFDVGYAAGKDSDEKVRKLIDDFAGEAIAKTAALRGVSAFGDALDEFDDIDTEILTHAYRTLLNIARKRNNY